MKAYVTNVVSYLFTFLLEGRNMNQSSPFHIYFFWGLLSLWVLCTSSTHKCVVRHEVADCSHLKLTQVPDDLPANITVLNLTHNQLRRLPAANFTRYSQLTILDGGYNSISKLESELCQKLPLLESLNLQHNELSHLSDQTFVFCMNLTELHLMSNSIKNIQNNPFQSLKVRWKGSSPYKKFKICYLNIKVKSKKTNLTQVERGGPPMQVWPFMFENVFKRENSVLNQFQP